MGDNYLEKNRKAWNARTPIHLASGFYDQEAFMQGQTSLNDIELKLLGAIEGKEILHLQCHFGQDSLSLARMGAKVTGVDLSDESIRTARKLNQSLGLDAEFINCDVFALPQYLQGEFDIVFTSYGAIPWLPDLRTWAQVISHFLKPGGQAVVVEFHPIVWMFDDTYEKIVYPYRSSEPIPGITDSSYADSETVLNADEVNWNHGLADIIGNLLRENLTIRGFQEYFYSPYDCFPETEKIGERQYVIKQWGEKVPYVFSVVARKPLV